MDEAEKAISSVDFETAKKLVNDVFYGSSNKINDPGMEGSLLYHMAMINKMSNEYEIMLEELKLDSPPIEKLLWKFYSDFVDDAKILLENILNLDDKTVTFFENLNFSSKEKMGLFRLLAEKTKKVEHMLEIKDIKVRDYLQDLFYNWTENIVKMRL